MSIDLNKIKQREVINCDYATAIEIVDTLESVKPFKYTSIEAVEQLETYLSYTLIIRGKLLNADFKNECKSKDKSDLLSRINYIIDHFNSALEINVTLINQSAQVTAWIEDAKKQLGKQKTEIEEKAKLVQEQIDNSEHTILSHVLTLMGIFSAIITIILSVIITSSSWINNADKADAVVAFVVPNAVALMAVTLLLSLIFAHNHRNRIETKTIKQNIWSILKSILFYMVIIVIVLATIISSICLSLTKDSSRSHILYILSPGEYIVKEETITPSGAGDEEKKTFFKFSVEDKPYLVEYDESLLHDGNLYFCAEHEVLE